MKRILFKIRKKLHLLDDEKITRSERYIIMSALELMHMPDTELTMHPSKDKYYIRPTDNQEWIKIEIYPAVITIVNHKFRHDVRFSNRAINILRNKFIEITETRRDQVEKMFLDNTENSLRLIYNRIREKNQQQI